MEVHLIWAQDENGGIGKSGHLPWHVSEDLRNFKKITLDSTIVMGRKTWESLPIKPLPNRENIVLSKTLDANILTFKSYEDCIYDLQKRSASKVFIIGGRSMYKLFFDDADFLHITNIVFQCTHSNNQDEAEITAADFDATVTTTIDQNLNTPAPYDELIIIINN